MAKDLPRIVDGMSDVKWHKTFHKSPVARSAEACVWPLGPSSCYMLLLHDKRPGSVTGYCWKRDQKPHCGYHNSNDNLELKYHRSGLPLASLAQLWPRQKLRGPWVIQQSGAVTNVGQYMWHFSQMLLKSHGLTLMMVWAWPHRKI